MRAIKDCFIAGTNSVTGSSYNVTPASLWTVRYSCDSVTAGSAGDGVDRWSSDGALVWNNAGSAHSWIVLRQTGIATNFELCISLEPASGPGSGYTIAVSPSAGFTGGSTTARPTATDEHVTARTSTLQTATDSTYRLHSLMSADGKSIYIFVYTGTVLQHVIMLGAPKQSVTGWTNPSWFYFNSGSTALDFNPLAVTASSLQRGRAAGVTMSMYFTGEGVSNGMLMAGFTGQNDLSLESPLFPIGLASNTATASGRHGVVYDLWWGLSNYAQGDTYPGDASRQFMQVGDVVVPNPTGVAWAFT
jgi:hypothetical protein